MRADSPSRPLVFLYITTLIIIAVYIRVAGASLYHLNPDEIGFIERAQGKDLSEILHRSLFETHPPLSNILRHFWLEIADTPGFQRSLALVFGLALIPVFYVIGKQFSGPWGGMGCAWIAAFSHGCIIQSYIARNYTMLLLWLSLCLYTYLSWRKTRRPVALACYLITGILAIVTHFSGVMAIFVIASVENIYLLHTRNLRQLAIWTAANGLLAIAALAVMHLWQPLLTLTTTQVATLTQGRSDASSILFILDYLFIYRESVIYILLLAAFILSATAISALRLPAMRPFAALAVAAVTASIILATSGIYQEEPFRRSLWLFPFIVPSVGCATGLLCLRLRQIFPAPIIATMLIVGGIATYSDEARYKDINEYMMTDTIWRDYAGFLSRLDATHLIIASRSDAFLVTYPDAGNIYDYYPVLHRDKNGTYPEADFQSLMPYYRAKLLFKPYSYNYTPENLMDIVAEANAKQRLEGVNTLVFTSTRWSRNTTLALIRCKELDKTVVAFPAQDTSALTPDALDKIPAIALLISKQAFLNELVNTDGKARRCLK